MSSIFGVLKLYNKGTLTRQTINFATFRVINMLRYWQYCVCVLMCCFRVAYASHIVGGEINLVHVQGTFYNITLNLYFDKNTGDPGARDSEVWVGLFSKRTQQILDSFKLSRTSITDIPNEASVCRYLNLSTQKITYSRQVFLDKDAYRFAEGFYIVYERCCRNAGVLNIEAPSNAGAAFYTECPPITTTNSSPEFRDIDKNGFACANKPFSYNFSATDANGDSLVYTLSTPLKGSKTATNPAGWPQSAPYDVVSYINGITDSNMIFGKPSLQINAKTGVLSVTGTIPGLYVFGVDCKEYRNKRYLGKVHREYQLLVVGCTGENNKPFIQAVLPGTNEVYQVQDTIEIDNRFSSCLPFWAMDTTVGQRLTVTAYQISTNRIATILTISPNLKTTINNRDTLKPTLCIAPCSTYKKPAQSVLLVVKNENNCTEPKYDSVLVRFKDAAPAHLDPSIQSSLPNNSLQVYPGLVQYVTVTGLGTTGQKVRLFNKPNDFLPSQTTSGIGQTYQVFTFAGTCGQIGKSPINFDYTASDSVCGSTKYNSATLQIQVIDSIDTFQYRGINICTPNGDQVNDVFTITEMPKSSFCPDETFVSIEIVNRWGTTVYKSNERNFVWNPEGYTDGIYFYILTYGSTKQNKYRSWLQVLR